MKKTCYILLVLTAVLTLCGCGIHKIDDPATAEKFTKAVEELGFTTEKETVDGGDVVTATYGKETAVVSYGQYDEMSSVTQMYDYFLKNASDNKDYTVEEGEGKSFVAIYTLARASTIMFCHKIFQFFRDFDVILFFNFFKGFRVL